MMNPFRRRVEANGNPIYKGYLALRQNEKKMLHSLLGPGEAILIFILVSSTHLFFFPVVEMQA